LFTRESQAFPGSNQVAFQQEKRRLQVAFLTFADEGVGGISATQATVLCMVADPATQDTVTTSTHTDGVAPTGIPAVGAAAIAGLGLVAGFL
jgi:hypothetical protein